MRRRKMSIVSRIIAVCAVGLLGGGNIATPVEAGSGLKIYIDQFEPGVRERITYGYDRDAVCTRGLCANGTTACLSDAACSGIGDGLCVYTTCAADFNLCDDNTTICADNGDCSGIGSGNCNSNPCAPPNEVCGVKVDSLTAGAPRDQTIWELVCDPATLPDGTDCQVGSALPANTVSWDFSAFNTTTYSDLSTTSSTFEEIESVEFDPAGDNSSDCGFDPGDAFPGRVLNREDKNPDTTNYVPTLSSIEREDDARVCDDGSICVDASDCTGIGTGACTSTATIWQRGVMRFEGIEGAALGEGESHLCHATDDGQTRTGVPLWRFPHQDGSGYYLELGDTWIHTPFNCEPVILAPAAVRVNAGSEFDGRQSGEIVNEGVVKLPSGHQFRSLVARTVVEYDVAINFIAQCAIDVDDVRTVLYLWEVPHLGTVVRLQSDKVAPDDGSTAGEIVMRHVSEMDFKFGLFPPLTLNVGTITNGSIDVSWDPGNVTSHIDGYRVYWSEESGGSCSIGGEDCTSDHPGAGTCQSGETCCSSPGAFCNSYENDSVTQSGQVAFNSGCSLTAGDTECATISGLDPATTYHLTVTSVSDFTNPESGVTTTYESALYPTQIPAVPVDLPIEASATTGGGASAGSAPDGDDRPGTPLRVDKTGSQVTVSWGSSCEAGDTGYGLYEGAIGNFSSHIPVSCSTGGTSFGPFTPQAGDRYFVAVPSNAAAEGSYGQESSGLERAVSASACLPQDIGAPVCP